MVDKLGLNFGSSATSARTSRDFIPHTPLDLGDATAGTVQDAAITASVTTRTRTNRAVPRNEASARDLSERAHGHHDDTDRLCSRLRGASSRLDGSRTASLTGGISAGAYFDGGCGEDFERTDLAGDLAGSGGLQTAATTEEEFTAADRQGGHVSSNKAGTTSNGTGNSTCSGTGGGTGDGTDSGTA